MAIPLALKFGLGKARVSRRLLLVSMFASVLPDIDVWAFAFGIPYESQWGHRGFTHSLGFAVLLGLACSIFSGHLRCSRSIAFFMVFAAVASHALLDAATNGGLGCELLWPFSHERHFFPWTPIQVSPLGVERFFSDWGIAVLKSEFVWVWLPSMFFVVSMSAVQLLATRITRRTEVTAQRE
jgi:inner membrane protein